MLSGAVARASHWLTGAGSLCSSLCQQAEAALQLEYSRRGKLWAPGVLDRELHRAWLVCLALHWVHEVCSAGGSRGLLFAASLLLCEETQCASTDQQW